MDIMIIKGLRFKVKILYITIKSSMHISKNITFGVQYI